MTDAQKLEILREKRIHPNQEFFTEVNELIKQTKKSDQSVYIQALCVLGFAYMISNQISKSEKTYKSAVRYAEKKEDEILLAFAENQLGSFFVNTNRYKLAREHINIALRIYQEKNDCDNLLTAKLNLGVSHYRTGDYKEAFSYLNECFHEIDRIKDETKKSQVLSWYGALNNDLGFADKAFECVRLSNEINLKSGNLLAYSVNQNTCGMIYLKILDYENALISFQEVQHYAEKIGENLLLADALNNIGMIYGYQEEFDKALEYYTHSLKIREKICSKDKMFFTLNNITLLCIDQDRLNETETYLKQVREAVHSLKENKYFFMWLNCETRYCLLKKEYKMALSFAKKTYKYAQRMNNQETIADCLKLFIEIYSKLKKYKSAFAYSEQLNELENELWQKRINDKMAYEAIKNEVLNIRKEYELKIQDERIKSVLAMAVSANHEINQPLMTIQGNLELLKGSLPLTLNDKQLKYLQKMDDSIGKISSILMKFKTEKHFKFIPYLDNLEIMVDFSGEKKS